MTIDEILEHDERFRYMMLDRMRLDCEYFLGNGDRYSKCLWTGNVTEQIEAMKAIYESFPDDKKRNGSALRKSNDMLIRWHIKDERHMKWNMKSIKLRKRCVENMACLITGMAMYTDRC